MSTRCQVLVTQKGVGWKESVMLYHHYDGYPSNIVNLLKIAKNQAGSRWEAGRAGKVAGFICSTDPGQFEPERGLTLHGDIEYLYVVTAVNLQHGTLAETPYWHLRVLVPGKGFYEKEKPNQKDMHPIYDGPLVDANGKQIEDVERSEA